VHEKDIMRSSGRALGLVRKSGRVKHPLKLKHVQLFVFNGGRKLTCFLIFGDAKKSDICVLACGNDLSPWHVYGYQRAL